MPKKRLVMKNGVVASSDCSREANFSLRLGIGQTVRSACITILALWGQLSRTSPFRRCSARYGSQLPRFSIAERPIRPVDENHVDHDVVRANGKLSLQFVGDVPEECQLGFLVISDCAGYLDQEEVR